MVEKLSLKVQNEARNLKLLFAIQFVAFGFITPFESIVFKKALVGPDGLPALTYIALIFMFSPLIGLVANAVVGTLADQLKIGKQILSILSLGTAVISLVIAYAAVPGFLDLPLQAHFILLFTLVLVYRFMTLPLSPLIDSETLSFLNKHSDRKFFGKYRFWGTFGWAIGAPLMGLILTLLKRPDGSYPYTISFVGAGIVFFLFTLFSTKTDEEAHIEKVAIPWAHLRQDRQFLIFLVFVFLGGVVNGSTLIYLGYFFEEVMTTPLQIGLIFGVWTLLEFPIMHYSEKIMQRFGNRWLITIGHILIGVKLILFSLFTLETPFWQKIVASLVHGPAFALHYLGMVDYVDRHAHPDMRATYMAILGIARSVIAGFTAGIVGAFVLARWDGAMLMKGGGVVMFLLALFYLLAIRNDGGFELKKS